MNYEILQSILGSKTVAYHAIFAKATGSVPAAVMLSQGIFWQEEAKYKDIVQVESEGYFKATAEDWYEATGITEEQQKTARARLVKCGILKEKRLGLPSKMHYRIDMPALVAVIYGYLNTGITVTVDYRSNKREYTRTVGGKFRQQQPVKNGNTYRKESNESLETNEEREATAEKAALDLSKILDLESGKKEKTPPPSGAPSPRQPGESTPTKPKRPTLLIVNQDDQYLQFDNPAAMELLWQRWCSHRQAIGHRFKTEDSVRTALNKLIKFSGGKTQIAGEIIDESIANGWQGLFALKVQKQNHASTTDPKPFIDMQAIQAEAERFVARMQGNG